MNILVTGGAGYLGSTLVPTLLSHGHRVRVIDRLLFGGQGLLGCCTDPNLDIVRADVCDEAASSAALASIDVVIHLAAIVGYPACARQPRLASDINVDGTRTLLRLRRPDQRFVFASTGSVYGAVSAGRCDEGTPLAPITLYGKTKADAEQLVLGTLFKTPM